MKTLATQKRWGRRRYDAWCRGCSARGIGVTKRARCHNGCNGGCQKINGNGAGPAILQLWLVPRETTLHVREEGQRHEKTAENIYIIVLSPQARKLASKLSAELVPRKHAFWRTPVMQGQPFVRGNEESHHFHDVEVKTPQD